jgi:universal stress protein E
VGVDPRHTHAKPSRLDDRLLQGASALTAQLGGTVSIVHAYEATVSAYTEIPMELMRLQSSVQRTRDFAEKTTRAVAKLAARYGIEAADCHVEEGITSEVIARLARRRDTDVLVLGAVSRSMLARPVIGSTAERVIDAVDCDLFVVKPAGFKTLVKRRRGKM